MTIDFLKSAIHFLPLKLQNWVRTKNREYLTKKKINHWVNQGRPVPPPHEVKQMTIKEYQKKYEITTLVETGTYLGNMVFAQKDNFSKIITIELGKELFESARKKFRSYKHIEPLSGDSGKVLNEVVPALSSMTIFWLDSHYSAGITARGEKDCPIYDELDAIFRGSIRNHILLIDDARCFNGEGGYPAIEELDRYVKSKNPNYMMEVKYDIIRFTSSTE